MNIFPERWLRLWQFAPTREDAAAINATASSAWEAGTPDVLACGMSAAINTGLNAPRVHPTTHQLECSYWPRDAEHGDKALHCMVRHSQPEPLLYKPPDYTPCRVQAGKTFRFGCKVDLHGIRNAGGDGKTIFCQLHDDQPGTTFFLMACYHTELQYVVAQSLPDGSDKVLSSAKEPLGNMYYHEFLVTVAPKLVQVDRAVIANGESTWKRPVFTYDKELPTANGILCRSVNWGLYAVWAKKARCTYPQVLRFSDMWLEVLVA